MMPPICGVCGDRFPPRDGGTVRFSNYAPLPEGIVGHPEGLVWFCAMHIEEARGLSKMMSSDAIREMK